MKRVKTGSDEDRNPSELNWLMSFRDTSKWGASRKDASLSVENFEIWTEKLPTESSWPYMLTLQSCSWNKPLVFLAPRGLSKIITVKSINFKLFHWGTRKASWQWMNMCVGHCWIFWDHLPKNHGKIFLTGWLWWKHSMDVLPNPTMASEWHSTQSSYQQFDSFILAQNNFMIHVSNIIVKCNNV